MDKGPNMPRGSVMDCASFDSNEVGDACWRSLVRKPAVYGNTRVRRGNVGPMCAQRDRVRQCGEWAHKTRGVAAGAGSCTTSDAGCGLQVSSIGGSLAGRV